MKLQLLRGRLETRLQLSVFSFQFSILELSNLLKRRFIVVLKSLTKTGRHCNAICEEFPSLGRGKMRIPLAMAMAMNIKTQIRYDTIRNVR